MQLSTPPENQARIIKGHISEALRLAKRTGDGIRRPVYVYYRYTFTYSPSNTIEYINKVF